MDAADEPRFRCMHKEGCSRWLKEGEAFTAVGAGPAFVALGTSASSVIVATLDGEFIYRHSLGDDFAVVTQVCISGDLVVYGNSRGQVMCLDWRSSRVTDLSTLSASPVRSLALGPDFTASTGSFFVSQEPCTVMMRSRSSSSSWADTIIFEDASTTAEFDKLFHGLPSRRERADSVVDSDESSRSFVSQLCCDSEHLFFPCKGRVYAYSLAKNRMVARMGGFSVAASGGSGSPDNDDGDRARRHLGVCVGGGLIIVHWGSRLVLCDRHNFDNHSFRVLQQYSLGDTDIRRVSLIGGHVVLCVNVPTTVRSDAHTSGADGSKNGVSRTVRALAAEIRVLTPGEADLDARVTLPASAGPIVAAPYSQAQISTTPGAFAHAATHCFLVCPRSMYILRVCTAAERVRWLVKQHQYPLSMHLCQQKYRREQVFMEVAGMHANYLWRLGRHVEAVRIWGEVHLPSAPARYWKIFVERLDAAGKIDLVVKWLPFNDRSKVGPDVYERLLVSAIDAGDYLTLLARVSRWPVLYKFTPILNKVVDLLSRLREEIDRARLAAAGRHGAATAAVGKGVLRSRSSPTRVSPTDSASDIRRVSIADAGDNPAVRVVRLEEKACVLLVTVFKLFEFGDRFVEAAQVLIMIDQLSTRYGPLLAVVETWEGDDESYARALMTALRSAASLAPAAYFSTKRLWHILAPAAGSGQAGAIDTARSYRGGSVNVDDENFHTEVALSPSELAKRRDVRERMLSALLATDPEHLFAGVLAERANMSLPDLTMMMVRVADAKMVERFREAVLNRAGDLD